MINRNEQKIEELLNGFADGELTQQEQAEVRQLVSADKEIAGRLKAIERCRLLVGSLPPAEPPAKVVAGIKQLISNRTNDGRIEIENRQGARHLLVRHVLAASVIVGLFGILAAVIFQVAGPTDVKNPVAVEPKADKSPTADAGIGVYSLQLQTADFAGVDAFVRKLLDESTWLKYEVKKEGPGRNTYRVLCSKGAFEALMSDLASIWSKFDSATLVVQTGDFGRSVAVEEVRPEQITVIAQQDTADERNHLAKDFAALNSIERITPERTVLALTDNTCPELIAIPKPVLTSSEKGSAAAPKGAADRVRVDLNIIISKY
ncbi:MAG: hypothetical protein JW749_12095 [Sedimentisphaerales bacterium]|nr:hypothetical protein [Sedimentisphaerales bacterium]